MVLVYVVWFGFCVYCSYLYCYIFTHPLYQPVSLKLFTSFQALPFGEIDGKQDLNPSFLFQTFWLCDYKVNNSVLQYFLENGDFMVQEHN